MVVNPIGVFQCSEVYAYDAARQGVLAEENRGSVVLAPGQNFEQALQDVEGFSHIWLLFQFHHNTRWKPKVQPPRGNRKVGVFASRAPYRPNSIGMSCVRLISISGRTLSVADHDLLDGTPILDIKPYVAYADSIPDATSGWLGEVDGTRWTVRFSDAATERVQWLEEHGVSCLKAFLMQQLADEPFSDKRKRVKRLGDSTWQIAYRTWRVDFTAYSERSMIRIDNLQSGYSISDLNLKEDPYADKAIHRAFLAQFS